MFANDTRVDLQKEWNGIGLIGLSFSMFSYQGRLKRCKNSRAWCCIDFVGSAGLGLGKEAFVPWSRP